MAFQYHGRNSQVVGLGEEREESTKHTNEHVIKKMGPHSLQRLHQEGAYLKCCFLLPLPLRGRKPVWHLGAPVVPVPGEPGLLLVPTALPPQNAHFWVSTARAPHTKPPEPAGRAGPWAQTTLCEGLIGAAEDKG